MDGREGTRKASSPRSGFLPSESLDLRASVHGYMRSLPISTWSSWVQLRQGWGAEKRVWGVCSGTYAQEAMHRVGNETRVVV